MPPARYLVRIVPFPLLPDYTAVESLPSNQSVDELVEHLLRDQDFLLSKEIKHKVEELNQLLVKAQSQKLKVDLEVSRFDIPSGGTVAYLDVKLFKQI